MAISRQSLWQLTLLVEGGMFVVALFLGWLIGRPLTEDFSRFGLNTLYGLAATLPMLLLLASFVWLPLPAFERIRQLLDSFLPELFGRARLIDLAVVAALAGLGEEALFRGVLQPFIGSWLGSIAGLCIASLIFGLLHAATPTYAVLATGMGLYLGLVWNWTGSLWAVSLAHGLYDFVALCYLMKSSKLPATPADHSTQSSAPSL